MSNEFQLEVFNIRIKVKVTLENVTENNTDTTDTYGIKNKNKLTYQISNTKYQLETLKDEIILKRETEEFIHGMVFKLDKTTTTEYYIKSLSSSISIQIKTKKLVINDNKIIINYETLENNNEYIYIIEMSDN